MNSVRPPEDFGLILEVSWDHSGPDRTIDLEVNVDHEWLTHIRVDSRSGADAHCGKAGRQRLQNIRPIDMSRSMPRSISVNARIFQAPERVSVSRTFGRGRRRVARVDADEF